MAPPTKRQKTAKHNSASAPSSRRSTRSQRPLLSFELIGRVASFASLSGKGRKNDLQNICVAVGPRDVGSVRFAALRDNLGYLKRCLGVYLEGGGQGERGPYKKCQRNILKWFEVNTDWTKHCTAENMDRYAEVGDESQFEVDPLVLFNNPVVAIEFDLADVLKFLVETMDIDVGSYQWTSASDGEKMHLVANAVSLNQLDNHLCLEYLVELDDGFDLHADIVYPADTSGRDENISLINMACIGDTRFDHFEVLLRHRSFDPNKPSIVGNNDMISPLMSIVFSISSLFDQEQQSPEQLIAKTTILLRTGADPTLAPHEELSSCIDLAKSLRRTHSVSSDEYSLFCSIITLMERHIEMH